MGPMATFNRMAQPDYSKPREVQDDFNWDFDYGQFTPYLNENQINDLRNRHSSEVEKMLMGSSYDPKVVSKYTLDPTDWLFFNKQRNFFKLNNILQGLQDRSRAEEVQRFKLRKSAENLVRATPNALDLVNTQIAKDNFNALSAAAQDAVKQGYMINALSREENGRIAKNYWDLVSKGAFKL